MITYQSERWAEYRQDCLSLWQEQYEAHTDSPDKMAMRPDDIAYLAMDNHGMLKIITARDNGRIVGHVISIIRSHLHYSAVICGFVDTFFLSKDARRGRVGIRLVKESIKQMHSAGASRVFFMTDTSADTSVLFSRLGFKPTNTVHSMWIGE